MKVAIITGGTRGIGGAISRMYLDKGYEVIVNYCSSEEGARDFLDKNKEFKDRMYFIKENLSTKEGMESFVGKVIALNKKIDAIVLNVGITERKPFGSITYEDWERVFNSNLNIPFFIIQGLYSITNENSHIVFISSVLGIKADGMSIPYGVSKGAISTMVKYLAKNFGDRNITVNAIAPGFINTDWHVLKTEEHKDNIVKKTISNRFGEGSEVASTCSLLEENRYITGQVIVVDGGYSIK